MGLHREVTEKTGVTKDIIKIIRQRHRYESIKIVPWFPSRRYFMLVRKKKIDECAGFLLTICRKICIIFVPLQCNSWRNYKLEEKTEGKNMQNWTWDLFQLNRKDVTIEKGPIYEQGLAIFDAIYAQQKKTPINVSMYLDWSEFCLNLLQQKFELAAEQNLYTTDFFKFFSCQFLSCCIRKLNSILAFFASFEPHPRFISWEFDILDFRENGYSLRDGIMDHSIRGATRLFEHAVVKTINRRLSNIHDDSIHRKVQNIIEYVRHNTCLPRQRLTTFGFIVNNALTSNIFSLPNNSLILAELVTEAIGQQIYTHNFAVFPFAVYSLSLNGCGIRIPFSDQYWYMSSCSEPVFDKLPFKSEIQRDFYYLKENQYYAKEYVCHCRFDSKPPRHKCYHHIKPFSLFIVKRLFQRYISSCRHISNYTLTTEILKRVWYAAEKRAEQYPRVPSEYPYFDWQTEQKLRDELDYCQECQTLYKPKIDDKGKKQKHECPLTFGRFLLKHTLYDPRLLCLISAFAEAPEGDKIEIRQSNAETIRHVFLMNYFTILYKHDSVKKKHLPKYHRILSNARKEAYPETEYLMNLIDDKHIT